VTEVDPRLVAALRAQLEHWRAALRGGAARVGWKIALGIDAVEQVIGAEPIIGYLTSVTQVPSGGTYSLAALREPLAETELAVEIGADGGVAGVATAIELADIGQPQGDFETVIASNVLHRAFVLGPTRRLPPGPLEARVTVNGALLEAVECRKDLAACVEAAARLLGAAGERLEPGDRIITGSLTHVPVRAGDSLLAEITGVGAVRIDLRF
jgi:2-keto-4-pentenoate hydratase